MYEENKEIKEIEEVRQKPTYYTTLPWQVRYDNSLTANEKILFSELLLLSKKNGYCSAQNSYFAELYNVKTRAVSRWVNNLKKAGYIKVKINFKEDKRTFDERRIYINNLKDLLINDPIDKNDHTPDKNDHTPDKNDHTPDKNDHTPDKNDHTPDKNDHTPMTKMTRPYSQKRLDPIVKNDQHNNIKANKIKANKINDDYKAKIKNHWNSISELKKIEYFSPTRENSIKILINDYGLEKIKQAIKLISTSDYLLGKTDSRKEPINFDWFIKPNNFIKVLEGTYNNKNNNENFTDFGR